MGTTYIRRYRMEFDLRRVRVPVAVLPEGYVWIPWDASLLERHAAAKYASFRGEIDARVFTSLGEPVGCRRLMQEIATHATFVPGATWLIARRTDAFPVRHRPTSGTLGRTQAGSQMTPHTCACDEPEPEWREFVDCGTIQGMRQAECVGSIQNVGVLPEHRGSGLGRALVLKSLDGFRGAGIRRVYLEVTAANAPAVRTYQSIGFRIVRTMYKPVAADSLVVSGGTLDGSPVRRSGSSTIRQSQGAR